MEKNHNCQYCGKLYTTGSKLRYHINRSHIKEKKFKCDFPNCGKAFSRKDILATHALLHDPEARSLVPCPICQSKFVKMNLKFHVYHQHKKVKQHKCETCSKMFSSSKILNAHQLTHLPESERPVTVCTLCDKAFLSKTSLTKHKNRIHTTNPKTFTCAFCSKNFARPETLVAHSRMHTGERPFSCSMCDMGFMRKRFLEDHVKIVHENEKYICIKCGKQFITKASLRYHLKNHTLRKNYKCSQCYKCFQHKSTLKKHEFAHSETRPKYDCNECDKTFLTITGLRYHSFKHSNTSYACDACTLEFTSPIALQRHVQCSHKAHESKFKCKFCEKPFFNSTELGFHVRMHTGEKPFACSKCPREFSQKVLRDTHVLNVHDPNSLKCKFCPRIFATKHSLGLHSRIHRREIPS